MLRTCTILTCALQYDEVLCDNALHIIRPNNERLLATERDYHLDDNDLSSVLSAMLELTPHPLGRLGRYVAVCLHAVHQNLVCSFIFISVHFY